MPLDVTGREATGMQAQDCVVEALETTLALGDEPRHKTALAVTRPLQVQRPRVRLHGLVTFAVAGVLVLSPVAAIRRLAQVGRQLGFQHARHHPFGQLLQQSMLASDVFRVGIIFEQFV
jgi:hypothetical protein